MDARVKPAHDELKGRAANSMRSLAPRSAAERGEGWGEGQLVAPLTRTRLLVESCALSPHPNSGLPEFGI
jgi:hypothetical protein